MKKIKDERLKLQNLKNIRIAYIVQTLGILIILGYDLITEGIEEMWENPLWIVLLISNTILIFLSMNISIAHEDENKSPKKSLGISILVIIPISAVIGILISLSEGFNYINGIIMGGIVFICGLLPSIYIYYLRNKNT